MPLIVNAKMMIERNTLLKCIKTCEITEGSLPKKQLRLVLAWAELHQDELLANWDLAMNSELPFKIEPLK